MYQKNAGTGTQWSQNYEAAADDSGSMRSGLVILQCSCSFPFSVQRLRLGPPLRSCDLTQTVHMSYLISRHRAFLILLRVNKRFESGCPKECMSDAKGSHSCTAACHY